LPWIVRRVLFIATILIIPGLAGLIANDVSPAQVSSQTPVAGAGATARIPRVYSEENTGAHFAAPTFPDFGRLPIVRPLPDPFRFFDGTRSTSFSEWERRRREISGSIQTWEIGPKPDASDLQITAEYTPPASADAAGRLIVTITRPSNGRTVTLNSKAWLPQGSGPFPVFIPMTGGPGASTSGPSYGQLSSVLSSRPIATVDFVHNQVTASGGGDKSNDPFYLLYPEFAAPGGEAPNDHGQYAAWSWGVSRLIDGIVLASRQASNPLPVNTSAIAVSGCSYAGKMALFAGAFDERIALTLPIESGGGGAPAWRVMQEIEGNREVESLTNTNYRWFSTSRMQQFSQNNVYKLPHDHHELGAMVAPRALLWTGNTDYRWLGNRPNYISSRAVEKVYDTLGIGDRFGFVIDGGHGHCAIPASQVPVFGAFVDKFLLGVEGADTNVRTHPYGGGLDPERFTAWWGRETPFFPRNWDAGDGKLVQHVERSLTIPDGGTVRAFFSVSLPSPHPEAAVTMVGGSVQLDIRNPDGRSHTLTVPFANNLGYVIPENFTGWIPSSIVNVPPAFVGTATAEVGGAVTNVVFSALGANLTPGAGNAAGPGLFTTADSPVNVRFHVDTGTSAGRGDWSATATVPKVKP
jgi:hypothetical protein